MSFSMFEYAMEFLMWMDVRSVFFEVLRMAASSPRRELVFFVRLGSACLLEFLFTFLLQGMFLFL